jgi:hypothetical protein
MKDLNRSHMSFMPSSISNDQKLAAIYRKVTKLVHLEFVKHLCQCPSAAGSAETSRS